PRRGPPLAARGSHPRVDHDLRHQPALLRLDDPHGDLSRRAPPGRAARPRRRPARRPLPGVQDGSDLAGGGIAGGVNGGFVVDSPWERRKAEKERTNMATRQATVRKAAAGRVSAAKKAPVKKATVKKVRTGRKAAAKKITAEDTLKLFLRT